MQQVLDDRLGKAAPMFVAAMTSADKDFSLRATEDRAGKAGYIDLALAILLRDKKSALLKKPTPKMVDSLKRMMNIKDTDRFWIVQLIEAVEPGESRAALVKGMGARLCWETDTQQLVATIQTIKDAKLRGEMYDAIKGKLGVTPKTDPFMAQLAAEKDPANRQFLSQYAPKAIAPRVPRLR